MDSITASLHTYLKCAGLKFRVKHDIDCCTSTNVETNIASVNIPASVAIDINYTTFSISIELLPFFLLDCQDINNIKAIRKHWNEVQRIGELIIREEGGLGIGHCFSLLIRINILSDANGLTRSLWQKYFKSLFLEMSQVCDWAYRLKKEADSFDIISM